MKVVDAIARILKTEGAELKRRAWSEERRRHKRPLSVGHGERDALGFILGLHTASIQRGSSGRPTGFGCETRSPPRRSRLAFCSARYWEGNVQATVACFLVSNGWTIESTADTASRQRGIDLVATKEGSRLAVEVKGYPGTVYARGERAGQAKPTAPTNQARHWFAQALLTAILTAGSNEQVEVGVAFPDMPRFRELIARSDWALRRLGIRVFLAAESGQVEELPGS